jgi:hypothetical protein
MAAGRSLGAPQGLQRQIRPHSPVVQGVPSTNPIYQAISDALSADRLAEYRPDPADGDADVLARYLWNIALGDALWSSLHIAEVVFRNRVHVALTGLHGVAWFDDPLVVPLERQANDIVAAKEKITLAGKAITPPRLVGELDFGFWTAFLKHSYELGTSPLWPALLVPVFPNLNPPGTPSDRGKGRQFLQTQFEWLRKLRNRISHHEPVWAGQKVGGPTATTRRPLIQDHAVAIEAIGWMSNEMQTLALRIDEFPVVLGGGYATHLAVAAEVLGIVAVPDLFAEAPDVES